MKRLPARQFAAYGLGLLTAVGGFAVGTAWAGHSAESGTISACAKNGSGELYLPAKKGDCKKQDTPISWSITGPQGPQGLQGPKGDTGATGPQGPAGAGTFSNAKSPNGIFTVAVSNSGIVLKGPNGRVVVDFGGVHVVTLAGASSP